MYTTRRRLTTSRTSEQVREGGGDGRRVFTASLPYTSDTARYVTTASSPHHRGTSASPPCTNTSAARERETAATVSPGRRIASPVPPSGCQEGGLLEGGRTPSPLIQASEAVRRGRTAPDRRGHAPCPAHRRPGRAGAGQQTTSSPMREEGMEEVSQRVKLSACHSACR